MPQAVLLGEEAEGELGGNHIGIFDAVENGERIFPDPASASRRAPAAGFPARKERIAQRVDSPEAARAIRVWSAELPTLRA